MPLEDHATQMTSVRSHHIMEAIGYRNFAGSNYFGM